MAPGCVWDWSSAQQSCKPEGPGPKLSDAEETPFGVTTNVPQHCLGHLAAFGRMFLRRLESPGELSGKAALGSSGCVGSPQRTDTQGQGLQWPLSPLEGRSGADFRAGSLFPKDELYPSRQRCDSPGNLRSYMTPKHQPGPRP